LVHMCTVLLISAKTGTLGIDRLIALNEVS